MELQILRQYSCFHSTPFAERGKLSFASFCIARFISCSLVHRVFTLRSPNFIRISSHGTATWAGPRCYVTSPSLHEATKGEAQHVQGSDKPQNKSQLYCWLTVKGSFFHNVSGFCRFLNFTAAQQLLLKISLLNSGYFNFRMSVLTG